MKTLEEGRMEACPEDDSKPQSLSQVSLSILERGTSWIWSRSVDLLTANWWLLKRGHLGFVNVFHALELVWKIDTVAEM